MVSERHYNKESSNCKRNLFLVLLRHGFQLDTIFIYLLSGNVRRIFSASGKNKELLALCIEPDFFWMASAPVYLGDRL